MLQYNSCMIIYVKGPDICCLASFTYFTGIWSIPVDVSERSLSICFSTSIGETQCRLKGCEVRVHSEIESTRSIRSDFLSGLVPSVLSFVLKKNVLSLFGSAWRGLGLGWRIRFTTLQTSFGRFDERALITNIRSGESFVAGMSCGHVLPHESFLTGNLSCRFDFSRKTCLYF